MARINVPANYYVQYKDPNDIIAKADSIVQRRNQEKRNKEMHALDVEAKKLNTEINKLRKEGTVTSNANAIETNKQLNRNNMLNDIAVAEDKFINGMREHIYQKMIPTQNQSYYLNQDGTLNTDIWGSVYNYDINWLRNEVQEYNASLPPGEKLGETNAVFEELQTILVGARDAANQVRWNILGDLQATTYKNNPSGFQDLLNQGGDAYRLWFDRAGGSGYIIDDENAPISSNKARSYDSSSVDYNVINQLANKIDSQWDELGSASEWGGQSGLNITPATENNPAYLNVEYSGLGGDEKYEIKYDENDRPYILISPAYWGSGYNSGGVSNHKSDNKRLYIDDKALSEYEYFDMADASLWDRRMFDLGDYYDAEGGWFGKEKTSRDRRQWKQPTSIAELLSYSVPGGLLSDSYARYGVRERVDNDENVY